MPTRPIILVEAPSNLGLRPPAPGREPGVSGLPAALRAAGLARALGVIDGGRVVPPPYDHRRDPALGVRNAAAIAAYSAQLADHLGPLVGLDNFVLVLGGDCSILLGSLLALRRQGRPGLLFVDGHTDFATPATTGTGGTAGMDLALATGRGLDLLVNLEGRRPLVAEADVVLLANRDVEDPATYGWREVFDTAIHHADLAAVRAFGLPQAAAVALARLAACDSLWLHVDADVLDSDLMPAVDSPMPDGLTFEELTGLLAPLLASGRLAGMQLTIFDPTLDPDGRYARALVAALGAAFAQAGLILSAATAPPSSHRPA